MKDAVAGFALLAAAVLGGPRGGRLGGLAGSTEEHERGARRDLEYALKFIREYRGEDPEYVFMKDNPIHILSAYSMIMKAETEAEWSRNESLLEEIQNVRDEVLFDINTLIVIPMMRGRK